MRTGFHKSDLAPERLVCQLASTQQALQSFVISLFDRRHNLTSQQGLCHAEKGEHHGSEKHCEALQLWQGRNA